MTEKFPHPGQLMDGYQARVLADLEIDPREGRRRAHTPETINRGTRLGLPSSI